MTASYETRPTLVMRAKRIIPSTFIDAMLLSLAALVIALILFGLFIVVSQGLNPIDVYRVMYKGAFGSQYAWRNSLIHAAPLLLTALCVALPARVGMIIIGGEGCVLLGGLAATFVAHLMPGAPPLVVQIGMVAGG